MSTSSRSATDDVGRLTAPQRRALAGRLTAVWAQQLVAVAHGIGLAALVVLVGGFRQDEGVRWWWLLALPAAGVVHLLLRRRATWMLGDIDGRGAPAAMLAWFLVPLVVGVAVAWLVSLPAGAVAAGLLAYGAVLLIARRSDARIRALLAQR